MDTSHPTEIAVSWAKALFLTAIGIGFVVTGIQMFGRAPEVAAKIPFLNVIAVQVVEILCVAFFGLTTALSVRRLFRRAPGLVLNARGVTDNTTAVAAGFVPWADIADVRTGTMGFLYLVLRDPEAFLQNIPPVQRAVMRMNGRIGLSPVVLTASTLVATESQMRALVRAYWEAHGRG